MWYLLTLVVLLLLYVFVIYLMKYMKNTKLFNTLFCLIIVFNYLILVRTVYYNAGPTDWNFLNTLPMANVSPFMFFIVSLTLVLPKCIRKYLTTLVSLLTVGMLLSTVFGCLYNAMIDYKYHFHFVNDYISHIAISLYGIYLVKSGQVSLKKRECIYSSLTIYFVAFMMIIINLIYDKSYFGLSLKGKHNIYNMVLVKSSYLSAFLYLFGLGAVLLLGYGYNKLLNYKKNRNNSIL